MKYILILAISCIACNNTSKNKVLADESNEVLAVLPEEIANKTWIYILENEAESYDKILQDSNEKESNNIITYKDSISFGLDEQNSFITNGVKSIKQTNNGYTIRTVESLVKIEFSWIKKNVIAKWKINIPNYNGEGNDFNTTRFSVDKNYVTPENFPIFKQHDEIKPDVEDEKPLDLNLYSEILESLPLEGQFDCDYTEGEDEYVFKGGKLYLSNKNEAIITFVDYLNVQCDVRKIKGSSNKYVLFYKSFIDTKFSVNESTYYSKTQPIAEIEIIDDNTIKKKWLGFYNRKTKQYENAEDFDWQDEYCTVIKRVK